MAIQNEKFYDGRDFVLVNAINHFLKKYQAYLFENILVKNIKLASKVFYLYIE